MLVIGSDDGLYRHPDLDGANGAGAAGETEETGARKLLDAGRVYRVRQFDALEGVFAATRTGLYHAPDGQKEAAGEEWVDLGVPEETVYAVGADPDGGTLYAGTRPAHVYEARIRGGSVPENPEWTELDGFRELPSRDEWRLPRHENLAQVRDVHVHPEKPERVVAAVEVGGVHASTDGGDTWEERRDDVDDDVHELHLAGADDWIAATGFGLFRTEDAGRTWERLDGAVTQRYFRAAYEHDGTLYAAGALSNSSTWDDEDADPELFVSRDGGPLEPVELPTADETVTGLTVVSGAVVAATHRGSLFVDRADGWVPAGEFPVPGELTGRYTPLTWMQ